MDRFGKNLAIQLIEEPMTKNSLQVPLVALNYSVEYFHSKYWPVSGVQMSGEWREWRAERK